MIAADLSRIDDGRCGASIGLRWGRRLNQALNQATRKHCARLGGIHPLTFSMRRRYAARVASVVFAATAMASNASAQPVNLIYAAPPECPREKWVLERIAALVRHQPSAPPVVHASIQRQGTRYLLKLELEGGKQRIFSDSCDSLVQTLSVIVALAIDPNANAAPPTPASPAPSIAPSDLPLEKPSGPAASSSAAPSAPPAALPSSAAPPPVAAARPMPVAVPRKPDVPTSSATTDQQNRSKRNRERNSATPARANEPPTHLQLHPALLLWTEYGMLPHLAHGPNIGLIVDYGILSLAATAEWLLPQWVPMPNGEQRRGGDLSFLGGQLGVCLLPTRLRLVGICVGVEAGDMMGKGSGVQNTRLGHGVWLAATTELLFRPRLWSWMSGELRLGLALPVKRPAFGFEDYSWKFQPEAWSLRLASGFSWF